MDWDGRHSKLYATICMRSFPIIRRRESVATVTAGLLMFTHVSLKQQRVQHVNRCTVNIQCDHVFVNSYAAMYAVHSHNIMFYYTREYAIYCETLKQQKIESLSGLSG